MGHHFFPDRLLVGILMMATSGVMYLVRHKRRPDEYFTPKQYLWGCVFVLICGMFVAIMAFGPE